MRFKLITEKPNKLGDEILTFPRGGSPETNSGPCICPTICPTMVGHNVTFSRAVRNTYSHAHISIVTVLNCVMVTRFSFDFDVQVHKLKKKPKNTV